MELFDLVFVVMYFMCFKSKEPLEEAVNPVLSLSVILVALLSRSLSKNVHVDPVKDGATLAKF